MRRMRLTLEFETDQTDLELELMLDNWYHRLRRTDPNFRANVETVPDKLEVPCCTPEDNKHGHKF
jgi:hypothetical protein